MTTSLASAIERVRAARHDNPAPALTPAQSAAIRGLREVRA